MNNTITLQLSACTVVAQRNGDTIDFVVRSHADGAEPFTIAGAEYHRILRAWKPAHDAADHRASTRAGHGATATSATEADPLTRLISGCART